LADVYSSLHRVGDREYSWYTNRRGHRQGRRFDHVFASARLHAVRCEYLHTLREAGLSDHSPIEVSFVSG
jgi:exonuclease III